MRMTHGQWDFHPLNGPLTCENKLKKKNDRKQFTSVNKCKRSRLKCVFFF